MLANVQNGKLMYVCKNAEQRVTCVKQRSTFPKKQNRAPCAKRSEQGKTATNKIMQIKQQKYNE